MNGLNAYIFFVISTVLFSCSLRQDGGQQIEIDPDSIIISSVRKDSIANEFIESVRATESFKNWQFNHLNPDSSNVVGYSMFEILELKIKDSTYYIVNLTANVFQSTLSSTIYPTQNICQFRINRFGKDKKIFDRNSQKYIAFDSSEGKTYLAKRLTNNERA